MSTIYTIKSICPAFCEKNTLFRRGVLLPKIEHPSIIRSRMDPSIAFLVSITEMFQLKTHITGPDSPFINNQKWQRHDWNAIAHNTRLSSSWVNPKLNQRLEPESLRLLTQLWIDAYSKPTWQHSVTKEDENSLIDTFHCELNNINVLHFYFQGEDSIASLIKTSLTDDLLIDFFSHTKQAIKCIITCILYVWPPPNAL